MPASSSHFGGSSADGASDDDSADDDDTTDDESRSSDDPDDADSQSDEDEGADDASGTADEYPRVDEPPQPIKRPDRDGSDCGWNDDYLGEHVETEPSLPFAVVTRRRQVTGAGLEHGGGAPAEYWVELVTDEDDRDDVFDLEAIDEETRAELEAVDFAESVLVVVQSGWGSGSVQHRWARVEASAGGLHLHGYYSQPEVWTEDYTWRTSVLRVARPDEVDLARVSLTVSEDRRVHFDSTEGVVSLEE